MGSRWRFPRTRRHHELAFLSQGVDPTDPFPALIGKPVPYVPLEDQTPLGTYCSCPPEGQDWVDKNRPWCMTCGMDVDPADLDP